MVKGLRGVLDFLGSYPHDYVPAPVTFLEIDTRKVQSELELGKKGGERGRANIPPPGAATLDDVERLITTRIERIANESRQTCTDNLQLYEERAHKLDIERAIPEIETEAANAVVDFKAKVHVGLDDMKTYRHDVIEVDREFEAFRQKHQLTRMATYPESRTFRTGFILLIIVLESALNGYFFARGNEFGLLGGILQAFIVALANIAIGFVVGYLVAPWAFHRITLARIAAMLALLAYVIIAVCFNIGVAHYRDALGGDDPERAAAIALQTLTAAPLQIADIESWLMVAVGCLFSFLAAADAFSLDDHYPGYGSLDRRRRTILQDYTDQKSEHIDDLSTTKDAAVQGIMEIRAQLAKRKAEYFQIQNARQRLVRHFAAHLSYLESTANQLLATYREANEKSRSLPPPAHFREVWHLPQIPAITLEDNLDAARQRLDSIVEKLAASLGDSIADLMGEYTQAIFKYEQIDKLTEDETSHGST